VNTGQASYKEERRQSQKNNANAFVPREIVFGKATSRDLHVVKKKLARLPVTKEE